MARSGRRVTHSEVGRWEEKLSNAKLNLPIRSDVIKIATSLKSRLQLRLPNSIKWGRLGGGGCESSSLADVKVRMCESFVIAAH